MATSPPTSRDRGPAVDAARWPDVATVPRSAPPRTAVARRLVRGALARLPVRTVLPDGDELGLGGPVLQLNDPEAFYRRLGRNGLVGFGESYLAGEWEAPDLPAVLGVFAEHAAELLPGWIQRLRPLWELRHPRGHRNTPSAARRNIHHHYDLSNDLFALFLDETLSYSCAVFRALPAQHAALAEAQRHKVERLLDLADVGPGTRLLEIGTGWGELALRAAERGAVVTTTTLSEAQRELAEERVARAGFADRVTLLADDYRALRGSYDAVVSAEMIEAVGEEYWPSYFAALERLVVPGGRVVLQAITMAHDRVVATRHTHTWVQKYVFPGGQIPSLTAIRRLTGEGTGLRLARRDAFGPHYAETLRLWRERFAAHACEVAALGFDEVFRRMWTFYLAYSEAGFRSGYLDLHQLLFHKEATATP